MLEEVHLRLEYLDDLAAAACLNCGTVEKQLWSAGMAIEVVEDFVRGARQ